MTQKYTELDLFESLGQDTNFSKKRQNNPILDCVFLSLFDYIKNGNTIKNLPWFDLSRK